jgi:nucleotidyltransferase substrate binding protein (TIGR01987 family)
MSEIFLSAWQKALSSLKKALNQIKNEYTRDVSIQRFKYCHELSWKTLKRYLKQYCAIEENNIKSLFRIALKQYLINNSRRSF